MVDEPKTLSQIRAKAHKEFDEAKTAANGVAKTAALWAAALAIVWISGLEPTLQTAAETALAFKDINTGRQDAERRATIRQSRVVVEKAKVERLKQFEVDFPSGDKRNHERDRLDKHLRQAKEKMSRVELDLLAQKVSPENSDAWKKARSARDKAANKLREFEASDNELKSLPLETREMQLKNETTALDEEKKRLKESSAEARKQAQAQDRNVVFKLFGMEFKAPPLLAPLLWCAFCAALLGYLAKSRAKSIVCCTQGIRRLADLSGFSGDEIADQAGRLPTWVVNPALATYAAALGKSEAPTLLAREPWVNRVFGSLSEQQFTIASIFLIPIFLWATELRVAWIALEFSRYLGTNWARSLLPLGLTAILGVTACLGGWWFFGEKGVAWLGRVKDHGLIALIIIVLAIISLLSWPWLGIHFAFLLQRSLLWLATLPVGLLIVWWLAARIYGLTGKVNRTFPPTGRGFTRRGAIIAMAGLAALTTLSLSLPTLFAPVRKTKNEKCKPLEITLKQGFYHRQPRSDVKTNKDHGAASSFADVLHYIGPDGLYSRRGRLPLLERLKEVRAPERLSYLIVHKPMDNPEIPQEVFELSPSDIKNNCEDCVGGTAGSFVIFDSPRVHLAAASWSFEEAAIAVLRQGPIGFKKSQEACKLLLCGIQHDLLFKQRIDKERKKGRPSFRLYDLLAGVSVRYRQEKIFEQLLEMIKGSEQPLVFQTRVEKWQDVSGPWHQRWRNRKKPVQWKCTSGACVF